MSSHIWLVCMLLWVGFAVVASSAPPPFANWLSRSAAHVFELPAEVLPEALRELTLNELVDDGLTLSDDWVEQRTEGDDGWQCIRMEPLRLCTHFDDLLLVLRQAFILHMLSTAQGSEPDQFKILPLDCILMDEHGWPWLCQSQAQRAEPVDLVHHQRLLRRVKWITVQVHMCLPKAMDNGN